MPVYRSVAKTRIELKLHLDKSGQMQCWSRKTNSTGYPVTAGATNSLVQISDWIQSKYPANAGEPIFQNQCRETIIPEHISGLCRDNQYLTYELGFASSCKAAQLQAVRQHWFKYKWNDNGKVLYFGVNQSRRHYGSLEIICGFWFWITPWMTALLLVRRPNDKYKSQIINHSQMSYRFINMF